MRKILIFCLPLIICLQGCSSSDEFWPLKERHITNFPSSSEKYGKAVAEEIRGMVGNLNEMGVDYSRANNTPEFKAEFYKDIYTASPTLIRTKSSVNQIEMAPEVFAERFANLTEIQKKFIGRIIKECEESTSFEDLANRIIDINDDIYSFVPEIQQERLFNITSVFYYGLKEIQNLEQQGQMIQGADLQVPRLKSGGEDWGSACRRFLATGWTIAIGEPTPTGEIVMAVATVIVAGVLLYEIVTCSESPSGNPNQDYCQSKYLSCSSPIPNGCSTCLQYCLFNGSWPPYATHQCN